VHPIIVWPDTEAHVIAQLAALPGITVWTYAATQHDPDWIAATFVQVDARAGRKKAARDLAEQARQVMAGLPGAPWPEGAVCYCAPVEGPFYLPDDDGSPRYVARYEVRAHPHRSAAAPARAATP
jgi:hypothetical protein